MFNVFLSNLQQVLDQNHQMGWCMLATVFQVLLYAPSLTTVASSNGTESTQNIAYTFSLWQMDAHPRRNWLMSVLVIMYKVRPLFIDPKYLGVNAKTVINAIVSFI